jgi:prepilin-type processing-associated H-X9-DG protein
MGRQSVDQNGMNNSRIGYRHPGPAGSNTVANACFADGHCQAINSSEFPCTYNTTANYTSAGGKTTLAQQEQQNLTGFTIYADPAGALAVFLAANPGAN